MISVTVALILGGLGVGLVVAKDFIDNVPDVPDRQALMVVNQAPGMTFEDMTGHVLATRGPKHGASTTLAQLAAYWH